MAEAQGFDSEVVAVLRRLYETTPAARELGTTAKGVVVFPEIFRENYAFGVQSGYGRHDGSAPRPRSGGYLRVHPRRHGPHDGRRHRGLEHRQGQSLSHPGDGVPSQNGVALPIRSR